MKNKATLEFVSYDGDYPDLCCGELILKLNDKVIKFPNDCLISGGNVCFDDGYNEQVEKDEWTITEYPVDFPEELKDLANELVNENVEHGCCGGCI